LTGTVNERRELNTGFSDALSRAVELVVTPMIMGGLGWLLDGAIGTKPFFALFLFLFTFGYVVWKMVKGYSATMDVEAKRFGPKLEKRP
jgi:F0F1-type ATP synthase assembly protein I